MAGKKISGDHNPDEVLLGVHAMPETKALAGLVAERTGRTITDVMLDGLMHEAYRAGIVDVDEPVKAKVKKEFRDEIILKAAQVRAAKKARQSRTKNERKSE